MTTEGGGKGKDQVAPGGLEALGVPTPDLPIPGPDEARPMARSGPGMEVPVVPANIAPMGRPRAPTPAEQAAALHRAGRTDDAIQAYTATLKDNPGDARSWANLGVALRMRGRLEAAAACYRRALVLEPNSAPIHSNLGNVLRLLGRHEEAAQSQRRALDADPNYHIGAYNMALQLRDVGLHREALAYFDRAIRGGYTRPEVMLDRAFTLLAAGDYAQGFAEYEYRLRLPTAPNPPSPAPEWDGGAIQGKSILVHVEPGPRDTMTFLRYVPLLGARGARVTMLAPPSMAGIMGALLGVADVVTQGKPPATDLRAPLNSLPRLFGATLETLPMQTPYLRVPPGRPARDWAAAPQGMLKVGVVWADRTADADRAARACPFTQFLRLAGVAGVQLFRLQTGPAAAERDQNGAGALVRDLAGEFADLSDAAEAMSQLDLVVGVDSALLLLAGGLGVPGFAALPTNADWRWGPAGESTPWFPSLRLFRQRRPGDWDELFQRLSAALAARASGAAEAAPAPAPAAALDKPADTDETSKRKRAAKRAGRKSAAKAEPDAAAPEPKAAPKVLQIPGILPGDEPAAAAAETTPAPEAKPAAAPTPAASPPPPPPGPPAEPLPMPELPPQLRATLDAEMARDGHRAAVRRFLDQHLKPREVVIDVGLGSAGVGGGLVSLAAATRHPGRVSVIALDADPRRVLALREAADRFGVAASIEALNVAAGARPTVGRAGAAPVATLDGLMADRTDLGSRQAFISLDTEGREPEIVAGSIELLAQGRVAALLWRRAAIYDEGPAARRLEKLLTDLAGLGFRHFNIEADDPAAALTPYDAQSKAPTIVSLPRSFALR